MFWTFHVYWPILTCRLSGASLVVPFVHYWWHSFPSGLLREAFRKLLVPDQWTFRVAHHAPWLLYWWMTQKWFTSLSIMAGNMRIFSPGDLETIKSCGDKINLCQVTCIFLCFYKSSMHFVMSMQTEVFPCREMFHFKSLCCKCEAISCSDALKAGDLRWLNILMKIHFFRTCRNRCYWRWLPSLRFFWLRSAYMCWPSLGFTWFVWWIVFENKSISHFLSVT